MHAPAPVPLPASRRRLRRLPPFPSPRVARGASDERRQPAPRGERPPPRNAHAAKRRWWTTSDGEEREDGGGEGEGGAAATGNGERRAARGRGRGALRGARGKRNLWRPHEEIGHWRLNGGDDGNAIDKQRAIKYSRGLASLERENTWSLLRSSSRFSFSTFSDGTV